MAFYKDDSVEAPDVPHLLHITNKLQMRGNALPPGTLLYVVEDPTRLDKILPLMITKVSIKQIELACACNSPRCNLRIKWKAEKQGFHPPRTATRSTVREIEDK